MKELRQEELNARFEPAAIIVEKIWEDYVSDPQRPGEMKAVEKVLWAKKGQHFVTGQKTPMRISQARQDPAIWAVVGPAYEAWKANKDAPLNGMPLEQWPGIRREFVEQLKQINIRSVEDLAGMNDAACDRFGIGAVKLRQDAKAFVEAKKGASVVQAELVSRDQKIAEQADELRETKEMLKQMQAQLAAMQDRQPTRGAGRPRKSEAEAA
jgi:hypothetical protein